MIVLQPTPDNQHLPADALDPTMVRDAQSALLQWFEREGRDLPWRHTRDPYRILIAGVMLQQTQVDRVLPKYLEFIDAFPSADDLAAAPRSEVIRRWAPLGYNLRAVRLHQIAQQVVSEFDGEFPRTEAGLLALKGIWPYTAGAVMCFAYEQPSVFLDTNLRRVIGRCFASLPYPRTTDDKAILAMAEIALPRDTPWAWHQALMDLGATVCAWAKPKCLLCPVNEWCRARHDVGDKGYGTGDKESARVATRIAEDVPVYRTQPKFAGSRRFYRGKIVGVLRGLASGDLIPLSELGLAIKADYTADDLPWLTEIVSGLAKDGLVVAGDGMVGLG